MAGKVIIETKTPGVILLHFTDEASAFGGIKKARIKEKGICNSRISGIAFKALGDAGIANHFLRQENERDLACIRIEPIPLQVIVRNRLSGTTARMLGVDNGTKIPNTVYELRYHCADLHNPMINDHHAVALGLASYDDLARMYELAGKANEVLKGLFHKAGIELIDLKLKFGRTEDGKIMIADEISPDNCRLWDEADGRILDKDRFRHDLSDVTASYKEVMKRLTKATKQ